ALFSDVSRSIDDFESLDNSDLQLELTFSNPLATPFAELLAALFAEAPTAPVTLAGVRLMALPGSMPECEEIGRAIRRLLAKGVSPTTIAIVARDTSRYGGVLEDVCRRYRIPLSYRRGAPLANSPLIATILAPLRLALSQLERDELLTLIGSTYLAPLKGPDGTPLLPERIEELLLAANYQDNEISPLSTRLDQLIARRRRRGEKADAEIQARQALLPFIRELMAFRGDKPLARFIQLLEGFIEGHLLYRRAVDGEDLRALRRDASAINALQEVLHNLEDDMALLGLSQETISPSDFLSLLAQGMEGKFLAGLRQEGVSIMNFHDCRGLSFDHLFVVALNEGICPKSHDSHPLLKDDDRLLVNAVAGRPMLRFPRQKSDEEPLLFTLALATAKESITLSYSSRDSNGNPLLRSPFLDELLSRSPVSLCTRSDDEESPLDIPLDRQELLRALAGRDEPLRDPGSNELHDELRYMAATSDIEQRRDLFLRCESLAERSDRSSSYTGVLERSDLIDLLSLHFSTPPADVFPPTALEEYGRCPFRFFLGQLLHLSPLATPGLELPSRDEGSLVHDILRRLYARLSEEALLPLRGSQREQQILEESVHDAFCRWEEDHYVGPELLWQLKQQRFVALLRLLLAAEATEEPPFMPKLFEFRFPPLMSSSLDGAPLFVSGTIDRLDVDPLGGRMRIVDYKLASDGKRYGDLLKEENMGITSFQMPIYLLAALAQKGEDSSLTALHACYWLLRRVEKKEQDLAPLVANGFFSVDLGQRQLLGETNFANRLCATVSAIRHGQFPITPRECDHCPFPTVCRRIELPLRPAD
ncbi:MAG TPA: PD-(D/E)XK nuclease family protein, partial [Geobacterales bacterium]|nr:PD-(D/E)XK nuclease family protein [Geobacterales bacterium]